MNRLKMLVSSIKRDGKMTADDIVCLLSDALCDCDCGEYEYAYKLLYEKAYGKTVTKELADEWVKSMEVTDGSGRADGMKFSYEKAVEIGSSAGTDWQKISKNEWYVALNMAYSDHFATAKKFRHEDDPLFFASMAKDEWCDDDDVKDKTLLSYYFKYVA